ncbi:MAG: peptidoglycan D,D-transpeptidase FtsI family protein [Ktedonobacterales bacterium]
MNRYHWVPLQPPRSGTGAERRVLPYWREQEEAERSALGKTGRRQVGLMIIAFLVLGSLVGRIAYWQIWQHDQLAGLANQEDLRAIEIHAGRGFIFDANGNILALSVTEDEVIADPDVLRSVNALGETALTLGRALKLPESLLQSELDVPGAYVVVSDMNQQVVLLSQQQSNQIGTLINQGDLPGIALVPVVRRVYPDGELAAQVLGFVRATDGTGQYGIEQQYDQLLSGQPGLLYTAVNAAGDPLATVPQRQTSAIPGSNVTLTIDASIQYWVEQGLAATVKEMDADGGTVIVMDPQTGAILAMASLPSFDPNQYSEANLASFVNPAISDTFDPGSVMKAMTMAMGINTGVITPDSTYDDTGQAIVDGITLHNWDNIAHGEITMTQVLQYSANTGAMWAVRRIGDDRFTSYLNAFGFLQPTGIGLPDEAAGSRDQSSPLDLTTAENSFGESIAVTPLQMVMAYGALANGGVLMRPYIVSSIASGTGQGPVTRYGPQEVRQVVSAGTAAEVTQMLVESAAQSEAQMNLVPGYAIAAKTGTSTPDTSDPSATFASVIGYAPATHPRFVLLVKLNHPRATIFGGSAAGPLWRALARQLFLYFQIPPDATGPSGQP